MRFLSVEGCDSLSHLQAGLIVTSVFEIMSYVLESLISKGLGQCVMGFLSVKRFDSPSHLSASLISTSVYHREYYYLDDSKEEMVKFMITLEVYGKCTFVELFAELGNMYQLVYMQDQLPVFLLLLTMLKKEALI